MNKENTKYLFEKYPSLFSQKDLPMTQTCMCWGFECGDGWFKIIDELCEKIQKRCEEKGYNELKVVQVKEKYGTLRFYLNFGEDEIDKYITEAEEKSAKTCEICGKKGKLIAEAWYVVRCKKCLNS